MIYLFIFNIVLLLYVLYSFCNLLTLLLLLNEKHCHFSLALLFDLVALCHVFTDHNALLLCEFVLLLKHFFHFSLLCLSQSLQFLMIRALFLKILSGQLGGDHSIKMMIEIDIELVSSLLDLFLNLFLDLRFQLVHLLVELVDHL